MVSKFTRIKLSSHPSLRSSCLSALHASYQGTSAMTSKVEASIFWPGITSDIQATRQFLHNWGIHRCLSSVAFPHSNCRAELGVKIIKRLITGNVRKDGAINMDAFQKAIYQQTVPSHVCLWKTSKGFNPYPA